MMYDEVMAASKAAGDIVNKAGWSRKKFCIRLLLAEAARGFSSSISECKYAHSLIESLELIGASHETIHDLHQGFTAQWLLDAPNPLTVGVFRREAGVFRLSALPRDGLVDYVMGLPPYAPCDHLIVGIGLEEEALWLKPPKASAIKRFLTTETAAMVRNGVFDIASWRGDEEEEYIYEIVRRFTVIHRRSADGWINFTALIDGDNVIFTQAGEYQIVADSAIS